ncbi:hypothetical protein ACFYWX_06530 [Streptomyces sp. NPDC002888]|uniref:hypothetical protein n=1 Tax=Streptomyces sp. NPDC002888 TaxID=3364668 RepID=UPI00368D8CE3
MARHASPRTPKARRALAALATAGVALGASATTAAAAEAPDLGLRPSPAAALEKVDPQAGLQTLTETAGHVTGTVADLKPNPLAGTGVDPLDNGVGTQAADFQPLDSRALTRPVAQAESVGAIPVPGQGTGSLGG